MARLTAITVLEPAIVAAVDDDKGQIILTEEGERLHCGPRLNNPDASIDDEGFAVEVVTAGGRGAEAWVQSNWTFELAGADTQRRRVLELFGDRVARDLQVTGSTGDPPSAVDTEADDLDFGPDIDTEADRRGDQLDMI